MHFVSAGDENAGRQHNSRLLCLTDSHMDMGCSGTVLCDSFCLLLCNILVISIKVRFCKFFCNGVFRKLLVRLKTL